MATLDAVIAGHLRRMAARITTLREMHGLSKRRLSELAGIGSSYVTRLESGERGVTLDTLSGLARGLGVYPYELLVPPELSRVDERSPPPYPREVDPEAFATTTRELLAERVRELRTLQGIPIALLEEFSGLHRTDLLAIERGAKNASVRTCVRVADALGVQVHELFLPPELSEVRPRAAATDEARKERDAG